MGVAHEQPHRHQAVAAIAMHFKTSAPPLAAATKVLRVSRKEKRDLLVRDEFQGRPASARSNSSSAARGAFLDAEAVRSTGMGSRSGHKATRAPDEHEPEATRRPTLSLSLSCRESLLGVWDVRILKLATTAAPMDPIWTIGAS